MFRRLPLAIVLSALAACATTPLPPLPPNHPANPDAPESSVAPISTGLAGDGTSQRTEALIENRGADSGAHH